MSKLYGLSYRDVLREFEGYGEYKEEIELKNRETKLLLEIIEWAKENNIPEDRLPRNTKELLKLEKLDLSKLGLTQLPESIGNLSSLTELSVSNNPLIYIPKSVEHLIDEEELKKIKDRQAWDLIKGGFNSPTLGSRKRSVI